jgi:integrase
MFGRMRGDVLTTTECENARRREAIYRLKDSPNLFLVVYPSGRKSWEYRYQHEGTSKALILGEYGQRAPALGPKSARAARDELATERNRGRDPIVAKKLERERQKEQLDEARAERERRSMEKARKQLEAERGAITVRTIVDAWIKEYRPHWSAGHAWQCQQSLQDHAYPHIGDKQPDTVEPAHILDLIGTLLAEGKVETARRVRQRLDAAFEHGCLRYGFRSNPVALSKRELAKRFKVAQAANPEEHFPCVSREQIPQLLRAMRAYVGSPTTAGLLWFVCLTGCRTGEARFATWNEFDLDKGEWKVPAARMKARRPHIVYLAPAVVELLRGLQYYSRGGDYLFPHPTQIAKPASENALLFVLAAIGFKEKHSGHGFRRMFSTLANESGLHRPDVIEAALAHKERDSTRAAYNDAKYAEERRRLANWYADELARLEVGEKAKVVGIR